MLQFRHWPKIFVVFIALASCSRPSVAADAFVLNLPGKYTQFAWGGAGRYLALHLEADQKVLVYDLEPDEPKLAFEVPDIPAGELLTAGKEKLIVVSPSKMMIRNWDFKSGKAENLEIIKGNDPPQIAVAGCAGDGPVLIVGKSGAGFFDLETLKPKPIRGKMIGGTESHGLSVHVSPDGQAFGTIPVGIGPVNYTAWHLERNQLRSASFGGTSHAIRWAQPSGDGYLMMLPNGVIFSGHGRPFRADWLKNSTLVPTPERGLVLEVRLDHQKKSAELAVCSAADCKRIHAETGFEELVPAQISSGHEITNALKLGSQWRVQYVPALKRIITLPQTNDRLVLRKYDHKAKLESENKGYLYLASTPPLAVARGKSVHYPIEVESSGKPVEIELEDRPRNTRLTGKTHVRWTAPLNHPDAFARFSLTIRDKQGQVILHSFEVAILPVER